MSETNRDTYSIALTVFQRNPDRGHFRPVERTVFNNANGGTWSEADGVCTLTMGGSGTSGVVRVQSTKGELVAIAVGVHNYKRWCDIVPDLKPSQTALLLNGEYYNNGPRASVREQQLSERSVTSLANTKIEINFTVSEGKRLEANVLLG